MQVPIFQFSTQLILSVTATAPTIGTAEKLFGTYTIMMVDPDIPPAVVGNPTSELLHWMQGGLVSASTASTVGGVQIFELINPKNQSAFASYLGPSPPAKAPLTHRYTQMLLNTTDNTNAVSSLSKFATVRTNFSAVSVVQSSGAILVAGNSFNVTNTTGSGTATGTISGSSPSSTPFQQNIGSAEKIESGAFVAGFGAMIAAAMMM